MAAEMRNASTECGRPSGGRAATDRQGEVAELIGQEELPLRSASAAAALARKGEESIGVVGHEPFQAHAAQESVPTQSKEYGSRGQESSRAMHCPIEVLPVPTRGGRNPGGDTYPFGALQPASLDEHGQLTGTAFFIPAAADPDRLIAAARKRHKPQGKVFITRKVAGGTMVWREK
jgi:hypothetical protein